MVPFESLGTVSYSSFIVTMAVSLAISETFGVKEWPDLEIWVWGCSRSLKMARLGRPCSTTFYWSAIVTIAPSCTIFELFDVENIIVTLKSGLGSLEAIETSAIRKLGCGFLFAFYSNYGAVSYCLRDIAAYWSKIAKFYTPPVFSAPARVTPSEFREGV